MLMALRFEPSRFFLKRQSAFEKEPAIGSKRKAINIYFANSLKLHISESTPERHGFIVYFRN